MHPAFSVIFLTTLIGVGQGLFLALYTVQVYATVGILPRQESSFYSGGAAIVVAFLIGGLIASFFHLGHPERAWRAAARWRTSWLAREVIVLPVVMGAAAFYGVVHFFGIGLGAVGLSLPVPDDLALVVGGFGALFVFMLFLCTGMIYAGVRFLREWATWLTVANYTLFGIASGFMLATVYSAYVAPGLVVFFAGWTILFVAAVLATRAASLIRNARLAPSATLQAAIGVRHQRIVQKAQGFMGGSFNTREFFHGAPATMFHSVKWAFLVLVFPASTLLMGAGLLADSGALFVLAFAVHYLGLLAERWFFFAQASHPQNLYYQSVA
jgi:sulfite dehydrogenase (quinone) subunit SoeC